MKKMKYSRRLLAATAVLVGLGAGSIGIGTTLAATPSENGGPMTDLIAAIAERFNVSETDVQAVFDEQHEKMKQDREAQEAEHLAQAVEDGDLTEEQASAIATKHAEDEAFFESLKSLNEDARKEALDKHHEETQAWAEENDIPTQFFMGHRGPGMRHGGPMERGDDNEQPE